MVKSAANLCIAQIAFGEVDSSTVAYGREIVTFKASSRG
jgi:hypothetical protein